jgi:hypothetical protein
MDGIAQGSEAKHLQHFPFDQPHFQEALANGVGSGNPNHHSALTSFKLIESRHDHSSTVRLAIAEWSNEDARHYITANADPQTADLQHAGTSGLQNLQATADANSQFRQTLHPGRFPMNFGHLGRFAGGQQFKWQHCFRQHA